MLLVPGDSDESKPFLDAALRPPFAGTGEECEALPAGRAGDNRKPGPPATCVSRRVARGEYTCLRTVAQMSTTGLSPCG